MSGMRVRSAPSKKEISDFEKRQMDGMMMGSGGSGGMTMGGSGMSKGDGAWTHAMHVHLVVSGTLSTLRVLITDLYLRI